MNTLGKTVITLSILLIASGCASKSKVAKNPDSLYKDGESLFNSEKYEDAIEQWKRVKEAYYSPELSARAELGIADAYYLNKDYIEAASAYEDFRKLHPTHDKAPYALFRQAMSHYMQISGIDTDQTPLKNAITVFESFFKLYPGTEHMPAALEAFRDCKVKQLQYEIYVGRFYVSTEKYPAAIGRFEKALASFQDSPILDELLFNLGRAYLLGGQKTKGREVYSRLSRDFPDSPFIPEANKVMDKAF